jgi:hypothetical protein
VAAVLFAALFVLFWASPVRHRTDSRYTLLLSEQLLRRQTFRLDEYFSAVDAGVAGKENYNLQTAGGHVHFRPAPGAAILSVPFVPVLRVFGLSTLDTEGRYDAAGEMRAQVALAAGLMAALTALFFLTARLLLPIGASLAVGLVGALGTQIWSTASRALWSHTWEIALIGVLVWHLARAEVLGRRLNALAAAALVSAAFLARPTAAGHAVAVTLYVAVFHRPLLWRFLAGGMAAAAAFLGLSVAVYGQPVPPAFAIWSRASPGWMPLATALVSPSRGLLVCVPVVVVVVALLVRYRQHVPVRPLLFVAAVGSGLQVGAAAVASVWWAGHSYGPRLTTGAVPWLVLLGILALRGCAAATADAAGRAGRWSVVSMAVLAGASVFIHGRGALAEATQRWNLRPADVDRDPGRVWNWRDPQWLAGLTGSPPAPVRELRLGQVLAMGGGAADEYLRKGWSWPESDLRWMDQDLGGVEFALDAAGPSILRTRLRRPPGEESDRAVRVALNGRQIAAWTLESTAPAAHAAVIDEALRGVNLLTFATSGARPGQPGRGDQRPLRLGVYWLRVDRHPTLVPGHRVSLGHPEADPYVGPGWGEPEGEYRWTVAPRAELFLAAEALPPGVFRLEAHAYPLSTRGPGQRVFISVGDELASTLALRDAETAVRAVPLTGGMPRLGRLRFELPDLKRDPPAGDTRRLGVAVHSIRYDPFPLLRLAQPVSLGGSGGAPFLGDGWAEPEAGRRWTVGTSADLYFAAEPDGATRLVLILDAFVHRRQPAQRVRFELNGERLAEITVSDQGPRPVELTPPAGTLRSENVLRLLLPDARSPASLGISRDTRVLGIRADTLELR